MGRKIIDLVGRKYGRITIKRLYEVRKAKNGTMLYWLCDCSCGTKNIIVQGGNLKSGRIVSCGCHRKENMSTTGKSNFVDLLGRKVGHLTVVELQKITPEKGALWICNCKCGRKGIIVAGGSLLSKSTVSCGCLSESLMANELKKYFSENYNVIIEYRIIRNPKTGSLLSYDIYLVEENVFIEVHGQQHYKFVEFWHGTLEDFEESKYRDKVKRKFARKNGMYIEIDIRKIKHSEDAIIYIEGKLFN